MPSFERFLFFQASLRGQKGIRQSSILFHRPQSFQNTYVPTKGMSHGFLRMLLAFHSHPQYSQAACFPLASIILSGHWARQLVKKTIVVRIHWDRSQSHHLSLNFLPTSFVSLKLFCSHLGSTGQSITRLSNTNVQAQFPDFYFSHGIFALVLLALFGNWFRGCGGSL